MKFNKKILLIRLLPKLNDKLGGRELLDNLIHENLKKIDLKLKNSINIMVIDDS